MSGGATVALVPASAITPEPVEWAWRDRAALRAVTLVVGDPGLGKSTLTIELAARLSRGHLDGDLAGTPAVVALATAEDALAQVVVPRLHAAGADLDRVRLLEVKRDGTTDGLRLPDDLDALGEQLRAAEARVFVVDPLVAHLPGTLDAHKDQHVRRAIAPLVRLAEELGVAVLAVVHLNKGEARQVVTRVSGSVAFVAAARSVLLLGLDPDAPDGATRVLAHAKSNLAPLAPPLRVRLESRMVEGPRGPVRTSGLAWVGKAEGVTVADLLRPEEPPARERKRSPVDDAMEHLRDLLANGPVLADEVEQARTKAGLSRWAWDKAKRRLRIEPKKEGRFSDSRWYWELPAAEEAGRREPPASSAPEDAGRPRQDWTFPASEEAGASASPASSTPEDAGQPREGSVSPQTSFFDGNGAQHLRNPVEFAEESGAAEEAGPSPNTSATSFFAGTLSATDRARLEAEAAAGDPLARRLLDGDPT